MLIGPKYKICKRLGSSVFEKCQTQKFQLAEARAPRRPTRGRRGGGSDFGAQLLESAAPWVRAAARRARHN